MKNITLAFICILITLLPTWPALAFNPGNIITDDELLTNNTMSVGDIQNFLNEHNGILKFYADTDIDGIRKSAALIVYSAADRHNINPQYLLVLLQKEQSLITDPNPSQNQLDWATGYAVCDSCSKYDPGLQKYRGFAKQVDWAAQRTRYYIENNQDFVFHPNQIYMIDGQAVYIENSATAALYNYTPHLHGNEIFYKLWEGWFKDFTYPNNSLLQAYGQDGVWLVQDGVRHPFTNKTALTSRFSTHQIIQVPKEVIEQYPIGPAINFTQYALLRIPSGKIYLLVDDELRWISDETTFRQLGYTLDEIEHVNEADLAFYRQGEPITTESLEPLGALLQDPDSYGIFYVKNGVKKPLVAPELLSLNFPNLRTRKASQEEIDIYRKGSPVLLKDGLLVKTADNPVVFVISKGQRRAIDSELTFNVLGYRWENINIVSNALLAMHGEGDPISVESGLTDEEAAELVESLN